MILLAKNVFLVLNCYRPLIFGAHLWFSFPLTTVSAFIYNASATDGLSHLGIAVVFSQFFPSGETVREVDLCVTFTSHKLFSVSLFHKFGLAEVPPNDKIFNSPKPSSELTSP